MFDPKFNFNLGCLQFTAVCVFERVSLRVDMAERPPLELQHANDPQLQPTPPPKEDMISHVMALEAALLPCLPARELQAIDRSPHPSHQSE